MPRTASVRAAADVAGSVDVLVNDTAILHEGRRTCRAFVPGMLDRGYGRVVDVPSGARSLAGGNDVKLSAAGPGTASTRPEPW